MALSTGTVRVHKYLLALMAIIGVIVYLVFQMVPGLEAVPWIKWLALGAALAASATLVFSGGGYGVPRYRKVRFFGTTDTDTRRVDVADAPPSNPTVPPFSDPDFGPIPAGGHHFEDVPYDNPYFTDVVRLNVTVRQADPAHPDEPAHDHIGTASISVNVSNNYIEALFIFVGGQNGNYQGSVFAIYGVDDTLQMTVTDPPVPIVFT